MKIKTAYRIITVLLLASLAGGCGKDITTDLSADTPVPVRIAEVGVSAQAQTRSVSTIAGGSMGVFRMPGNGYTGQYNSQYSYSSSSGWQPANAGATVHVGGHDASLCAYYPHNAVTFAANGSTCTLAAQIYNPSKDLCYATASVMPVSSKRPQASFAMKRAYARIKLSISRNAGSYAGACNISDVNIRFGAGFCEGGTLDISNGTYGPNALTGGGWTHPLNMAIADGATNDAYDVLVLPQPATGGLSITLTIDGQNRKVTVPEFTGGKLTAGNQYVIRLTITDTAVIINGGITVIDMATGSTVQNDTPIPV